MICVHQNGAPLWVNPDHIIKVAMVSAYDRYHSYITFAYTGAEYVDETPDQILDLIHKYHDLH